MLNKIGTAMLTVLLLGGACRLRSQALSGSASLSGGAAIRTHDHSASLTWGASASPSIAGYNIYRATSPGGPYVKINAVLIPGLTYTDRAVQSGRTYYYVATATDSSNNESGYSNEAKAIIPEP